MKQSFFNHLTVLLQPTLILFLKPLIIWDLQAPEKICFWVLTPKLGVTAKGMCAFLKLNDNFTTLRWFSFSTKVGPATRCIISGLMLEGNCWEFHSHLF